MYPLSVLVQGVHLSSPYDNSHVDYFFLPCYRHSDPLSKYCTSGDTLPKPSSFIYFMHSRVRYKKYLHFNSNNLGKPYLKQTILVLVLFLLSVEPVATILSVPKLSSMLCGRPNVLHHCQKQMTTKKLTLILQNEPSLSSHLCRMTLGEIFRCVINCQFLCNVYTSSSVNCF